MMRINNQKSINIVLGNFILCLMIAAIVATSCAAAQSATRYKLRVTHKSKSGYWDVKAAYPSFSKSTPLSRFAEKGFRDFIKKATADFMVGLDDYSEKPEAEFAFDASLRMTIVDDNIISGFYEIYTDYLGAHPNRGICGLTYGLTNGKPARLRLRDIMLPKTDLQQFANAVIVPGLSDAKQVRIGTRIGSLDLALVNNFTVSPAGITWIFPTYSLGPYAEGEYFIKVPWVKMMKYMNPVGPLGKFVK